MPARRKAPPGWLIDGIGRVRKAVNLANRSAVPPTVAMVELALGAWLSQALYVVVRLGIPDALKEGPRSSAEIAQQVGSDPSATYRVMRALASNGVLKLRGDGRFALTRIGQTLRSDYPGSMAPFIAMAGSPDHWEHWGSLLESVRTGRTAVEILRGMPTFEYIETRPAYAELFNNAMTATSEIAIQMAVPLYDFGDRKLIVDVGGGHGALLAAVLAQSPGPRGVLFDLPSVIDGAGALLEKAGVADRCTRTGGSFFDSVPDGGDAYLMKTVIHDWDDEKSTQILRNIRTAIAADGKLLLMELVLPEGAPQHPGMLVDLEMLVHAGGRERTAREYGDLLAGGGFRLTRVIPTAGPMSIVEAVPA